MPPRPAAKSTTTSLESEASVLASGPVDAEPAVLAHAPVTAEAWAERLGVERWLFAATRAHNRWAVGKELSEADFRTAVESTGNIRIGYTI